MNTKQLKYVQTLAREGTFSKAASALNITQPSLSQYIKKIEKEIGIDLFDRTNGEVKLTDAGRVYLKAGRQILDIEHQMDVLFSDLKANKAGSLIIGTAPYRAASMMPVITKRFQDLYPGIHLIIREDTTSGLMEGMEHGEYDLCLTMLPVDERQFTYEKVVEEELILAVPAEYAPLATVQMDKRRYPAADIHCLNDQRLVQLTDTQFMQIQLKNLCHDYSITLKTAAVVKSLEAQIEMVRAGVGMALMPSGIERFDASDKAVFYSFVQPLPKRQVVVMWRKDRELSEMSKELKKTIHDITW